MKYRLTVETCCLASRSSFRSWPATSGRVSRIADCRFNSLRTWTIRTKFLRETGNSLIARISSPSSGLFSPRRHRDEPGLRSTDHRSSPSGTRNRVCKCAAEAQGNCATHEGCLKARQSPIPQRSWTQLLRLSPWHSAPMLANQCREASGHTSVFEPLPLRRATSAQRVRDRTSCSLPAWRRHRS